LNMALGRQIVNLIRLNFLYNPDQVGRNRIFCVLIVLIDWRYKVAQLKYR
jgi:hypothetical protein